MIGFIINLSSAQLIGIFGAYFILTIIAILKVLNRANSFLNKLLFILAFVFIPFLGIVYLISRLLNRSKLPVTN